MARCCTEAPTTLVSISRWIWGTNANFQRLLLNFTILGIFWHTCEIIKSLIVILNQSGVPIPLITLAPACLRTAVPSCPRSPTAFPCRMSMARPTRSPKTRTTTSSRVLAHKTCPSTMCVTCAPWRFKIVLTCGIFSPHKEVSCLSDGQSVKQDSMTIPRPNDSKLRTTVAQVLMLGHHSFLTLGSHKGTFFCPCIPRSSRNRCEIS